MSIKALAVAILQGNKRRNQRETQSFLANKLRKPERQSGKLELVIPLWQQDFCLAHGTFNNWRGCCPLSIEDCFLTHILKSEGDIQMLPSIAIGQGITTDNVVNLWRETDESLNEIMNEPLWFVCMAEFIASSQEVSRNLKCKG